MLLTLKKKQLKKLSNTKGIELLHTRKIAGGAELNPPQENNGTEEDTNEAITHDFTSYTTG
ncbi:hypothetical protein [Pseudoalteromonas piscicida]|uniref:hypothetical protein n=1 Tax=Pseudoalteromonas piscicida TaxID=43662 RepID=UPI0005FA2615|nr:hypothetical protein [Pseudoalteromonas piscicida]KJZ03828.1 hypothetical protein TW73_06190 [Pseudoalteromonas piscicida]